MADNPDFIFHRLTCGPTEGGEHNPIRKSMQARVDKIREVNLERNGAQGLDRVLVVVLGSQDTAEWAGWPDLVAGWFWQGVPETQFQPALTAAKSAAIPRYEASLARPVLMTNRGILVRGERVSCFHVVGCPRPSQRGSMACGMQFLDELWDSARDAQAQLTAYDENVEVHVYLGRSDSAGLVHKWCGEKGVGVPEWLSKKQEAAKKRPDVCPGMDRLESILRPAEMELLQTQYEEMSTGDDLGLTRVEPILCTAGRFAKIKAALRGFMPDDLFGLLFAATSTNAASSNAPEEEEDIVIVETTQEGFPSDSPPRVHPKDRLGAEVTDLRSVIGGGSKDSAMSRLGTRVDGGRRTDERRRSRTPDRSSPSAWSSNRAPRDMLRRSRSRSPSSWRRPLSSRSPERDELVLVRREKDVYTIKNENAYIRYLQAVPVEGRSLSMPWTPDISRKMSGNEWEDKLMDWRREIHTFDPNVPPPPRVRSRSRPSARERIAEENRRFKESSMGKRLNRPQSPEPLDGAPRQQTDPVVLEGRKRLLNDLAFNFPRFRPVYDQYLKAVPKELRRPDMPMTPDIHQPNYVNSKEFSTQARNHQPSLCDLAVDFVVLQWMICLVFRIPGHDD